MYCMFVQYSPLCDSDRELYALYLRACICNGSVVHAGGDFRDDGRDHRSESPGSLLVGDAELSRGVELRSGSLLVRGSNYERNKRRKESRKRRKAEMKWARQERQRVEDMVALKKAERVLAVVSDDERASEYDGMCRARVKAKRLAYESSSSQSRESVASGVGRGADVFAEQLASLSVRVGLLEANKTKVKEKRATVSDDDFYYCF